jgi:hypothetical protein
MAGLAVPVPVSYNVHDDKQDIGMVEDYDKDVDATSTTQKEAAAFDFDRFESYSAEDVSGRLRIR